MKNNKKNESEKKMKDTYTKYNWTLTFWNGDNFRKWKWYEPCPCGCDRREDIPSNKLVGYYSGGFGFFGFTLTKREITLIKNPIKTLNERKVQI